MGKQRENQSKNNQLMAQKVKIIYELICQQNIMELVELLSDQNLLTKKSSYRDNRKKSLRMILRKGSASKSDLKKQFHTFKIAKFYMEDRLLFDEIFFFESDIPSFTRKAEAYISYRQKQAIDIDTAYKYIYMFDHSKSTEVIHNVNNLIYYKVHYAEIENVDVTNDLKIKVYPPESKPELGEYKGTIKKRDKQIVLMFENRYDSVHIIFNPLLVGTSDNPLFNESYYGLAIGINDHNQQTPVAKKVVFSKKKFTSYEIEQLYLIINETQQLEAKENIYALDAAPTLDADHLVKYHQKIKDIHTFFSNVKYSKEIDTTIMHHMVFAEFHVFHKMFEKFAMKQDYFLHDRKRVFLEFIRFLQAHPSEKVQMVFPLYLPEENILLHHELGKLSPKKMLLNLVKQNIQFEIIFVVEKPVEYQNEKMQMIFEELYNAGIKLSFAAKKEIEHLVSSCDFCYTQNMRDAIFKSRLRYKKMFTITQNREQIKNLMQDFQTIQMYSHSYEEVHKGSSLICMEDPVLKKLFGRWHLYFYGSFSYLDGVPVFWEVALEVKSDYSVVEVGRHNRIVGGKVEIAPNQTLFSIISKETENSFYIVMTNSNISDVTPVMIYSKQEQNKLDMAAIGIASREKLMKEEAQVLLGDPSQCTLKVNPMLQMRIDNFILAHKVSSQIQLR